MRAVAQTLALAAVAVLATSSPAVAQGGPRPGPYEDAGRSFRNILPPGQNGHASLLDIGRFLSTGTRPPHNADQLQMYEDLVFASPRLESAGLHRFFKDASFGVPPGQRAERYPPCGGPSDPCDPRVPDHPCTEVTVVRDAGFGVPHIYGATRGGAMCAAGYVAAEDRLFLIDVLRHAGRAQLSSFAGGSEGNRAMDRAQWAIAPYRERDLQRQISQFDDLYGREGGRLQRDLRAYVAGLNQYVFETRLDPVEKLPGAYAAVLGPPDEEGSLESAVKPERFEGTDVVAIASLVGGIFGKGGGRQLDSALLFQAAQERFGDERGEGVWADLRSDEDPEAPTTVRGRRFPYMARPDVPAPGSLAMPDPGTVQRTSVVESSTADGGTTPQEGADIGRALLDSLLAFPGAGSNALLVSGRESASGHPLAVFGPQTGYFSPQLLMEMDIHGPGIDARGAAFAGTNLYVQLGRGVDYAWSATSAGDDNVDTFALELCEPDGSEPTLQSDHYRYRGRCRPFDVLRRVNRWTPNAADTTPPGVEVLRMNRTKLGLEIARATADGDPVVYVRLRSTYLHEVDSARGFADFNNPQAVTSARDFQRAASKIGYTFNWFYADERSIAYFNSGDAPQRADGIAPNFPTRACPTADCPYEWEGYAPIRRRGLPTGNRARYLRFHERPQAIDQRYLTSWNNKQAPGYRANDAQFNYTSIYRSIPLDERIERGIRGARKMTLVELVDAMEDAGTVDLRGDQVLPWLLRVMRPRPHGATAGPGGQGTAARHSERSEAAALRGSEEPCPEGLARADAVELLHAWHRSGAHRRSRDRDDRYEHSCAIQIMDAWWPRLVEAIYRRTLGNEVYELRLSLGEIDNEPNNDGQHLGSAYQTGFYGYVEKDLRTLLGRDVKGPYSRIYCGGGPDPGDEGSLAECRAVLGRSLDDALDTSRQDLYGEDEICESEGEGLDAQYCYDAVYHRPVGAITQPLIHWINRPTFQQVVEVRRGVPRSGRTPAEGARPPRQSPAAGDEGGGSTGVPAASRGPDGDGGTRLPGAPRAGRDLLGASASAAGRSEGTLPFTGMGIGLLLLVGGALLVAGMRLRAGAGS